MEFIYVSVDMEEGYLGIVMVIVCYMINEVNEFLIYLMVMIDVLMYVNFMNYNYWNFVGVGSGLIFDYELWIDVKNYFVVDDILILIGE